jgi:hypothetical protein
VADVRRGLDRVHENHSRAQLLLLGAILLALIFAGLALVVNSAIFAENLATRQSDTASRDISQFRNGAISSVADAIGSSNQAGAGDSFTTLRDGRYQPRVNALAERLASRGSLDGAALSLSTAGSHPGTQIVDDDPATDIVPRSGSSTDWTMVRSAHIRAFEAEIDPDDGTALNNLLTDGDGDALILQFTPATGAAYEVVVYHDSRARVAVSEVGSDVVRECDTAGPTANLSLTGRPTVDGAYCGALATVAGSGVHEVNVTDGGRATGTYRLVVDRTNGGAADESLDEQVDRLNYDANCSPAGMTYFNATTDSPHSVPAIYAGTIDLRYRSQRASSTTTVRVAPAQAGDRLDTPLVTSLDVTDSSGSTDASFTVDWTTADPNSDPTDVTVTATNLDDGDTTTVAGPGAAGTGSAGFTEADDSGDTYDITVTVTDGTNQRSRTVTHVANGDSTECPS